MPELVPQIWTLSETCHAPDAVGTCKTRHERCRRKHEQMMHSARAVQPMHNIFSYLGWWHRLVGRGANALQHRASSRPPVCRKRLAIDVFRATITVPSPSAAPDPPPFRSSCSCSSSNDSCSWSHCRLASRHLHILGLFFSYPYMSSPCWRSLKISNLNFFAASSSRGPVTGPQFSWRSRQALKRSALCAASSVMSSKRRGEVAGFIEFALVCHSWESWLSWRSWLLNSSL